MTVLARASIVETKHHNQKQGGEERIYFTLHLHIRSHHQGEAGQGLKQGRNLDPGAEVLQMPWRSAASRLPPYDLPSNHNTPGHQSRGFWAL